MSQPNNLSHGLSRRSFLAVVLAAIACSPATTGGQTPSAPPPPAPAAVATAPRTQADGKGYLLVADAAQTVVYVYQTPGFVRTGQLDNILLGAHLGIVTLPDGRIIASDDKAGEIIAIRIADDGRPSIVNRVKADLGVRAVWGGVDPGFSYFVAASEKREGEIQTATIVNLRDFTAAKLDVEMKEDEELHPYLAGTPLTLFLGVGGEIQAYSVDEIFKGTVKAPLHVARVGLGSHGLAVQPDLKKIYLSTALGLDTLSYATGKLEAGKRIPWDVGERTTGRNARPRLSFDGKYVYGAVARTTPTEPERWAEREQDMHIADLSAETAKRLPITRGIVSRFPLSQKYALFVSIEKDGDFAYLFDVDPTSPTFQTITSKVPLDKLANGPVAEKPTAGTEARYAAISPDGRYAFVSHGGDGKISVIDTSSRAVTKIDVPSPLKGGGYLAAVQPTVRTVDLMNR